MTGFRSPHSIGSSCIGSKISLLYSANSGSRRLGWGERKLAVEWTIREVLNWTRGYFKNAGITQPRLEAEILLAHALDVDRLHLYLSPDKPLTTDERDRFRTVIQERKSGTPLQHLIGEVTFFGLRFKVTQGALIPRPETEELLERTLRLVSRDRAVRCLDLGTGSGIIAVCLARYLPLAEVTGVDVSADALVLARENAAANGVEERIEFLEGDWFAPVSGAFDLVVSNPPYVATSDLATLSREVRGHEPRVALDGGIDGLERIAALVGGVREHLAPNGVFLLEIGYGQAERVIDLLRNEGLTETTVEKDVAGVERFVMARCP